MNWIDQSMMSFLNTMMQQIKRDMANNYNCTNKVDRHIVVGVIFSPALINIDAMLSKQHHK